jgi:hypothetical protein
VVRLVRPETLVDAAEQRNDLKREGSNDPNYKGTCDIQCQCGRRFTRKLAGWIKQGRNGKFLTLSLKPSLEGDDAQADDAGDERDASS